MHGRILDALPAGRFGRLHEVSEGRRHVLHGVDQHDLSLAVGGAEASGAGFHDLAQLDDGGHGVLGSHGQLFLAGCCTGYQGLGVLNQSLGGFQNVFSVF